MQHGLVFTLPPLAPITKMMINPRAFKVLLSTIEFCSPLSQVAFALERALYSIQRLTWGSDGGSIASTSLWTPPRQTPSQNTTFHCHIMRRATVPRILTNSIYVLTFAATVVGWCASAQAQEAPGDQVLKALHGTPVTVTESLPEPTPVSFTSNAWVYSHGATHRIESHLGQESLYLDGQAYVEGTAFRDGIIEVDIAPNTDRSFAGLIFRVKPEEGASDFGLANFEEVYLRLHKSGLPDAVQYIPIYNGESTWQLYREYQAAEEFNQRGWIHLKVVVAGERAAVYLDNASHPSLVVDRLRHGYDEGAVGLFALFGNHFANFRYTPVEVAEPPMTEPPAPVQGTVLQWALSEPMLATAADAETYPGEQVLENMDWLVAEAEPSGLVPISKYRARPESGAFDQNPEGLAWTRLIVDAERAGHKKLFFDYSDKVVVFLNGEPVFAGNNAFRSKGVLERGDLGIDGNALFLDLRAGENEILIAVTERANGWGLMARFAEPSGLTLRLPAP